ncbi:hypothetical protein TPY_3099 [Sulfobacillus acidophilus TPY]|nr:hypothetical protein TPY_3099 [Sulfobacillus acidophilus TPY]
MAALVQDSQADIANRAIRLLVGTTHGILLIPLIGVYHVTLTQGAVAI